MRPKAFEARVVRLEVKCGTGRFDGLSYEQAEQLVFDRLHRLATAAGGIDELMAEWDAATDPEKRSLIAQIRSHARDVHASYLEMGPGYALNPEGPHGEVGEAEPRQPPGHLPPHGGGAGRSDRRDPAYGGG